LGQIWLFLVHFFSAVNLWWQEVEQVEEFEPGISGNKPWSSFDALVL
jgi:hypothetical protein